MHRELIELGRYRLDRGLTYRQLATAVNDAAIARRSAFRISHSRLFTLLNNPKGAPNDLTRHSIREFLEGVLTKKTA